MINKSMIRLPEMEKGYKLALNFETEKLAHKIWAKKLKIVQKMSKNAKN